MVAEAEEYAEQDKAVKAKVDARNKLETYCYNMKSTLADKLGDKLEEDDKETVSLTSTRMTVAMFLQVYRHKCFFTLWRLLIYAIRVAHYIQRLTFQS